MPLDKKEAGWGIGVLLLTVALPHFLQAPLWSYAGVLVGTGLCLHAAKDLILPKRLLIEDWPVHNALNLRVTNKRYKHDLMDSQLTLLSLKWWDGGRGQFMNLGIAQQLPLVLYSDQLHLPLNEPRMFQLLQFKNKTSPTIEATIGGQCTYISLPRQGIWEFAMELRWGGSGTKIPKWVKWDSTSLPVFCSCPKS
jgi:hypothetical protein